jgi:surface carbohydrate biosynthesis protein
MNDAGVKIPPVGRFEVLKHLHTRSETDQNFTFGSKLPMRILIHADSLARDPAPLLVLAGILEKKGHKVLVASRPTIHFYIRFWRPDLLVHTLPNWVGALYTKGFLSREGPRVVVIPQEGSERADETIRALYDGFLLPGIEKVIDHIFIWNRLHYDWLKDNSRFSETQLSIVGNVRLDLAKYGGSTRKRSGVVGFVGRFPTFNKYDLSDPVRGFWADRGGISEDASKRMQFSIATQLISMLTYADTMHNILKNEDLRVSLRPHHEEAMDNAGFRMLRERYGNRIEFDRSLSIYEWALRVDVIVSTSSASFAEAYLAGTPVICIDRMTGCEANLNIDEAASTGALEGEMLPTNRREFYDLLNRCLSGEVKVNKNIKFEAVMQDEYSWPYAGSALERAASAIDQLTPQGSGRRPRLPVLAGDAFYVLQGLRSPGGMKSSLGKHYNRLFHGIPEFVRGVLSAISADCNASNRPS